MRLYRFFGILMSCLIGLLTILAAAHIFSVKFLDFQPMFGIHQFKTAAGALGMSILMLILGLYDFSIAADIYKKLK